MRDASRDEAEHLAPVSYLPWAVPGVDRSADARDVRRAGARDVGREDDDAGDWNDAPEDDECERLERRAAARPGPRQPTRGPAQPVVRLGARGGMPEAGEPGVERDARIDALVVGRLRRSSLSVAEVRAVLTEHGLDEAETDEWIARYERLGYLDDVRLAEQLVRTGAERRGRGSGAILAELTRRGVGADAIRAALDELDPDLERRNALTVAERRARQLRGLDRSVAERRLTAFLQRRGYESAVVREAVAAALSTGQA
ncbi:regulatory protein RecX [Agromyces aerolatus]|uniref:regulatory protein RecX n=1 Tax=Agromyces sp. LY-1074 TaxID=3074080 RepID=UPI0028643A3B|nr:MULTISPECIES: regulatory protein RecX [unclassified Agromyces]MDR5701020.1 regulatory protein RecX [Agromyces sp. LY-1074]MDR5707660.1 regulatory protein RecX [Agromyces sp. LY-1358]